MILMSSVNNAENPSNSLRQMLDKKVFIQNFDFICVLQGTVFKNGVSGYARMVSLLVE